MDENKARDIAIRIRDEIEDLLDEKNITIPSLDREGVPDEARLYGEENSRLEEAFVGLLREHTDVTMTNHDVGDASHPLRQLAIQILDEFEELLAEKNVMIPSDDREGGEEEACLYGEEYYQLEDAIVDILVEEASKAQRYVGGDDEARGSCKQMQTKRRQGEPAPTGIHLSTCLTADWAA